MRYALLALLACHGLASAAVSTDFAGKLNEAAGVKVAWNAAKLRTADVDCDGKPDLIAFGTNHGLVWMGIIASGSGKAQVMSFPLRKGSQDSFDSPPTRISVYPLICETAEDAYLDGCRQVRGCKSFSLDNDQTDPFDFYWDARHKRLGWWRN